MKREIKFRAWDGKEMNYKDLGAFVSIDDMTVTPVRCELMQFTGLIDKNGVDIYEGDIVRITYDTPFVQEVIYDAVFGFVPIQIPVDYEETYASNDEIEVIGNIHQNPELL